MALSPPDRRVASAWALSVLAHAALLGVAGLIVARSLGGDSSDRQGESTRAAPHEELVDLDLRRGGSVGAGLTDAPADRPLADVPRGGGAGTPRLDSGRRGRGGTDEARTPALNLADRDDGLMLSREAMSKLDRDQIQRLRSSSHRASREDWRASREPMELTLLASGTDGSRLERRRPSRYDPSRGVDGQGSPARVGTALGGEPLEGDGIDPLDPGGPVEGTSRASLGVGVRDGAAGFDARDSAHVALARPRVPEGTPSIPAALRGRPSDTLDSEQDVSLRIQSIVHASTPGGLRGIGPGGQDGPGAPGSGGRSGPGSVSRALGDGDGPGLDTDGRRSLYLRGVLSKIHPLWYFPKEAALQGKQGTVIVSFTIRPDGTITAPRVTRSSNIPEFDEICRQAVQRAAPFEPLPPELGSSLPWSMPFDGQNPAVRPKAVRREP